MASITGTSGNDTLSDPGAGGSGTLTIVLSGAPADGAMPMIDVQVNGVAVQSGITVTADHTLGQTQTISVPVSGSISTVGINYTNDLYDYTNGQDRNLYISSVTLDGTSLPASSTSYARTIDGKPYDTMTPGQFDMIWGGTLTFSGSAVTQAAAGAGTGSGSNTIDGGAGLDTLVFGGASSEYGLSHSGGTSWTVTHGGVVDTLTNVERLHFNDQTIALDMDGNAGWAVKIISALFGSQFAASPSIVGIVVGLLDSGLSPAQLAEVAVNSAAFHQLAGGTSNTAFVNEVYHNLTGIAPSQATLDSIVSVLDNGTYTQASLGLLAAGLVGVPDHVAYV